MLNLEQLTPLQNFGRSLEAPSWLFEPQDAAEVAEIFALARREGLKVALRGAGRSYNDAALNGGGIVMRFNNMNRIESWDARVGVLEAQPGVTLEQVWQQVLPDGWWPPVVSGTMKTTLGGCLGLNIHGKNNFQRGVFAEHVLSFTVLLPTGEQLVCSPRENKDLFYAIPGGLGVLGVVLSIRLQMKPVYSGYLNVREWRTPDLRTSLDEVQHGAAAHDYIVGWLDSTARGTRLGRGQLHAADYLSPGDDPAPEKTLQVEWQTLPARFFGVVPKRWLPMFMRPLMNAAGLRLVNTAKYLAGRDRTYLQSHAAFHFLLDYIPDWENAYGAGGLVQYQAFVPRESAYDVFREMLSFSQQERLFSYLAVLKRHRPDDFLLSHGVDGFSLALDFKVTQGNRSALRAMFRRFDDWVVSAGGRFYFAKNSETTPQVAQAFWGEDTIARFRALKLRCDPDDLLQSNLYRRLFQP